jgi:RNA polymerase sigma-70 factor (ECF subfamily)
MTTDSPDTEQLVEQARRGDDRARQQLLVRHRSRLRRMVAVHLDRRLAPRVDPSDVVQEALADAAHDLDVYLRERPLPFYPWLRRLAWERLVKLRRHHLRERRNVHREEPGTLYLPNDSAVQLARILIASGSSPSRAVLREELQGRVQLALGQLREREREVLVLRYLEGLSTKEIAAVLAISEGAVKMRHLRALDGLRQVLDAGDGEGGQP